MELGTQIAAAYTGPSGDLIFNSTPSTPSTSEVGQLLGSLVSGGFNIDVLIKALEDRGVARRLAEPNLIARSGESASFLAGGEFPIPVSEEDGVVTVTYKKYGVSLDFTPTVLQDGLISLEIAPEVSSIDAASSYQVGNISVPGFIVRRAHTSVDLKSGQSFMIAGLLQTQNDTATQRIPGLGRMPILGALFSSKSYQRRETDLVIIVTPYLVKPMDPSKKAADSDRPGATGERGGLFPRQCRREQARKNRRAGLCRRCRAGADLRTFPRSAEGIGHASTDAIRCLLLRPGRMHQRRLPAG